MSGAFPRIQKGASIAWALIEFGILVWIVMTLPSIRDTWLSTAPERATVLTVEMPGFWGPVHALVPLNCSRFTTNDKTTVESMREETGHEEAEVNEKEAEPKKSQQQSSENARLLSSFMPPRAEHSWSGEGFVRGSENVVRVVDQADQLEEAGRMLEEVDTDESAGVAYNDTHIIVNRCGRELMFPRPEKPQNFWAMTWAGGWDSMQELRATRCRMLWFLAMLCVMESILGLAVATVTPLTALALICPDDHPLYMRLERVEKMDPEEQQKQAKEKPSCCTIFRMGCKALCSLPLRLLQKYVFIQGQMAILTLFFLLWFDDYYVTSYIPGKAYIAIATFYVSLPFLFLGFASGDSACTACATFVAIILGIILLAFLFGMMGFGFYQISFLWNACFADVAHEQSFGYQEIASTLRSMCILLFGAHLSDLITGFVLKLVEVVFLVRERRQAEAESKAEAEAESPS